MNEAVWVGGPFPARPLLELMVRAKSGRWAYRPGNVSSEPELNPIEEADRWLRAKAELDPGMRLYLEEEVPPESRQYVLNRVVDMAKQILYSTMDPWRTGPMWSQFERYAGRVVQLACFACITLDEDPCDPLFPS